MNEIYGVKLIAIGVDSYFKSWKQIKGSVIWGDFFDTKSEALNQAKSLSL
tara:strand:- start:848 stop:997 length:150 start_codon:yes stop_codon:yes gene_type:complete